MQGGTSVIEKAVDRIVQRLIEEQLLEQGKRAFYVYALQLKCDTSNQCYLEK